MSSRCSGIIGRLAPSWIAFLGRAGWLHTRVELVEHLLELLVVEPVPAEPGRRGLRLGRRGRRDSGGELGDGLVLEEEGGAELEAGLAGAGDELDAEDGVAAEGEEVVVDADALDAEDGLPDAGEG